MTDDINSPEMSSEKFLNEKGVDIEKEAEPFVARFLSIFWYWQ
jgi:hypothetical protein